MKAPAKAPPLMAPARKNFLALFSGLTLMDCTLPPVWLQYFQSLRTCSWAIPPGTAYRADVSRETPAPRIPRVSRRKGFETSISPGEGAAGKLRHHSIQCASWETNRAIRGQGVPLSVG